MPDSNSGSVRTVASPPVDAATVQEKQEKKATTTAAGCARDLVAGKGQARIATTVVKEPPDDDDVAVSS